MVSGAGARPRDRLGADGAEAVVDPAVGARGGGYLSSCDAGERGKGVEMSDFEVVRSDVEGWDVRRTGEAQALSNYPTRELAEQDQAPARIYRAYALPP